MRLLIFSLSGDFVSLIVDYDFFELYSINFKLSF